MTHTDTNRSPEAATNGLPLCSESIFLSVRDKGAEEGNLVTGWILNDGLDVLMWLKEDARDSGPVFTPPGEPWRKCQFGPFLFLPTLHWQYATTKPYHISPCHPTSQVASKFGNSWPWVGQDLSQDVNNFLGRKSSNQGDDLHQGLHLK